MGIEAKTRSVQSEDSFEIEISHSYSLGDKKELAGGEEDPSRTREYKLQWRPTETHIFVCAGGKKLCHVGIVEQSVEIAGNSVGVAGIGGVLARSESRGRGYGRIAMRAAEDFVRREMSVNFILLFCRPLVDRWYEFLGWSKISNPVWIEQPQGEVLLPLVSMAKCLGIDPWPEGDVHVGSRPW